MPAAYCLGCRAEHAEQNHTPCVFNEREVAQQGINLQAAKRIKTSESYRSWYTSESKDIIKIAFQEDLDLFGYKF